MNLEEIKKLQDQIPRFYKTEEIDFENKIIYQRYHFDGPLTRGNRLYDSRGFNWLLAELNEEEETGFGYCNLNDDQNAEWGYMYLPEIVQLGAVRDERWLPVAFPEAKKLCYGYKDRPENKRSC